MLQSTGSQRVGHDLVTEQQQETALINQIAPHAKLLQLCLILCDPMDCSLPGSSVHGIQESKNTGVDCHALLQGIFPTQGSNPCLLHLLHWQSGSLPLMQPGKH